MQKFQNILWYQLSQGEIPSQVETQIQEASPMKGIPPGSSQNLGALPGVILTLIPQWVASETLSLQQGIAQAFLTYPADLPRVNRPQTFGAIIETRIEYSSDRSFLQIFDLLGDTGAASTGDSMETLVYIPLVDSPELVVMVPSPPRHIRFLKGLK